MSLVSWRLFQNTWEEVVLLSWSTFQLYVKQYQIITGSVGADVTSLLGSQLGQVVDLLLPFVIGFDFVAF